MRKQKTFEESMAQLEEIVKELESGQLPLEKSLKTFELGMLHSKFCLEKLDEAEKRITMLVKDRQGVLSEEPYAND
ncbi:MAG: exodeoxyribonuclease VII small subunit [Pseudomonadota bacterium]